MVENLLRDFVQALPRVISCGPKQLERFCDRAASLSRDNPAGLVNVDADAVLVFAAHRTQR